MPWCPKCKTEYRKGFTVCSDCNTPLVEKLVDEEMIPFFQAEEKRIADKLVRYFEYSGLPSDVRYYEDNQIYVVSIPARNQKEAKKLYQAFYFVEREKAENETKTDSETENDRMDDISTYNSKLHTAAEENENKEQDDRKNSDLPMKTAIYETMVGTKNTADTASEEISTEDTMDASLADISTKNTADAVSTDTGTKNTMDMLSEDTSTNNLANTVADDTGTNHTTNAVSEDAGSKNTAEETDPLSSLDVAPPEYDPEEEPVTYVLKSEQYKDLNSTFWIFLIFGIAGILILVLNFIGIFHFINGAIPSITMGALFVFFLYVALSTHYKAKKVQAEIKAENELTEKINEWLAANITEDFLSSIHIDSISPELNYMRASETIHDMLIKEFGPQNNAYLDRLLEEFYNRTFDHML
ncbi:MAG: DUF805 domain-containing protein [Lachnospiraceae bacterium]|jgi:hypothetical protein|nr:DUF805 domain-containing protein [Lachnospiraceae bacterium]